MGCDAPCASPWYAIRCPSCNGTRSIGNGIPCPEPECIPDGEWRGQKRMRRCPGHYQTREITQALRAWRLLRDFNTWPVDGGTLNQAATFLDFIVEIEQAIQEAKTED